VLAEDILATRIIASIPEGIVTAVTAKLRIWKERLQDLSGRNRLLFFKPSGSYTVEIKQPEVLDLFQQIVVEGKKLNFPTAENEDPETEPKPQHRPDSGTTQITVNQSSKSLHRSLYNLRSRARTALEEQGLVVVYLALGFLEWTEVPNGEVSKAPLVLIPVAVERVGVGKPYSIEILEEDIVLNPSLEVKLRNDYNLTLPDLPDLSSADDLRQFFIAVSSKIVNYPKWGVLEQAFVSVFNFQNLVIINDMERNADFLVRTPLVQSLSLGKLTLRPPEIVIAENELDDKVSPVQTYQVLDADSSQQKAIEAAKAGASMIIQGPPGTGKSQTIANIIAEFLASGKKVLFVSQKIAALEVVQQRLEDVGLAHFCLQVHSHRRNKKEVIEELGSSLNRRPIVLTEEANHLPQDLQTTRTTLNAYASAVHTPRLQLRITPFRVYGLLSRLSDTYQLRFDIQAIEKITADGYRQLVEHITELASFEDIINDYDQYPWKGATYKEFRLRDKEKLDEQLLELRNGFTTLVQYCAQLAEAYNAAPPERLREAIGLLQLATDFKPSVFSLPLQEISSRYRGLYRSLARYLLVSYWRDRASIKTHLRSRSLTRHDEISKALANAANLARNSGPVVPWSNGLEAELEAPLGHFSDLAGHLATVSSQVIAKFDPAICQPYIRGMGTMGFKELIDTLESLIEGTHLIQRGIQFRDLVEAATPVGLGDFIKEALRAHVPADHWRDVFDLRFYTMVLDAMFADNAILATFSGASHETSVAKFRALDKQRIRLARTQIQAALQARHPDTDWMKADSSEVAILRREMNKKRRIKPLRRLFKEIPELLTDLKPCLMLSPLTVSQLLDPRLFQFDLVIFDEASQIPPEYAACAFARGSQVIIAGDRQQLPPTRFFQTLETDSAVDDQVYDEFESVLNECNAVGMPDVSLNWHYRSRDESLIAFSNYHFYGNRLYTFPSPDGGDKCIEFRFVPNGIYRRGAGGHFNLVEAREVVTGIIDHFEKRPTESLGVVAFSQAQRDAIEAELDQAIRDRPSLQAFLKDEGSEPFFIKNLEWVQGDERDHMFFSVGYGKDEAGKFLMNFGPLNIEGGERRLNVAVTRARNGVRVYSSIQPEDIDLSRTSSRGAALLRAYLALARDGLTAMYSRAEVNDDAEFDSPFERVVFDALTARGLRLHQQVGVSGYRIDMAVVDPAQPGRFLLGIECDGAMYHSAATARDRDRLRQEILEGLGWEMHRIWSRDWYSNREQEIDKVLAKVSSIGRGEVTPRRNGEPKSSDADEELFIEVGSSATSTSVFGNMAVPPGAVLYREAAFSQKGYGLESFYKATPVAAISVLVGVVNQEGPISVRNAKSRLASAWGVKRIGSKIDNSLSALINRAVSNRQISASDGFLWPITGWNKIPRLPDGSRGKRPIQDIALEEIAECIMVCMRAARSLAPDDLVQETARLFGLRVTPDVKARIVTAARTLQRAKRIEWRGDKVRIPDE